MDLTNKKCVACEGNVIPFNRVEAEELLKQVPGWVLSADAKTIGREFKLADFKAALAFVGKVAELAESEGHHPDIYIFYNKVKLELSTHAIGGLSENDFILSAKINQVVEMR